MVERYRLPGGRVEGRRMRILEVVAALARVGEIEEAGGASFGPRLDVFYDKRIRGKCGWAETVFTVPAGSFRYRPLLTRPRPAVRHTAAARAPIHPSWLVGETYHNWRTPTPHSTRGRFRPP